MNAIKGMIYESLFNKGIIGRSSVGDENSTAGVKAKATLTSATGSTQTQPIASKAYNATTTAQPAQRVVLKDVTNKAAGAQPAAGGAKKATAVTAKPAATANPAPANTTNTATKRSAAVFGTSRPLQQSAAARSTATRTSAPTTTAAPSGGAAGGALLRSSGVTLRGEKENVNPNSLTTASAAAPRAASIPIPSAKAAKTTTIAATRPPAAATRPTHVTTRPSSTTSQIVSNTAKVSSNAQFNASAPKEVTLKFNEFEVSSSEDDEDGFESAEDDPAVHFRRNNNNKRSAMEDSTESLVDSDTSDLLLNESNMKMTEKSEGDLYQEDADDDDDEDEGEAMEVDDEIINHHQVHKLVHSNQHQQNIDLESEEEVSEGAIIDDRLGAGVEDIDAENLGDPRFLSEYINEIYDVLRKLESDAKIEPEYMSRQKFLLPWMRGVLVDWLTEVSMKCMLRSDTLFLAVQILDRFLQVRVVPRSRLQLIGATALLIASKFEETFSLPTDDLVVLSDKDFSKEDLIKMERVMLHDLKWNLTVPTSLLFLRRYGKAAQSDLKIHTLSKFIIELSLAEYSILRWQPSTQAAASIYLARRMVGLAPWNSTLVHYSGFVEADLIPCARQMNNLIRTEISKTENAKAVVLKYKAENFFRVARIPPLKDL